jgi:dipeptidyl aminopeptidase/acylaminoacyl peptidase
VSALSNPDGRARGWDRVAAFAAEVLTPGLGLAGSFGQPSLHPTRDLVAATAEVRSSLEGRAQGFVALVSDEGVELVREGRRPVWSPDGSKLAHLDDDGVQVNDARLGLGGFPERLAWSPDGTRLLVVVAEPGSEVANLDGSGLHPHRDEWVAHLSSPTQHLAWRRLVVVDVADLRHRTVGRADLNVWDACWAGDGAVVAVCSDGSPTESAWYRGDLRRIDLTTGSDAVLARPTWQIGAIAASSRHIAYVEAVCSDRDLAAGRLHLVDGPTLDVPCDVTHLELVDDGMLGFAGVRGLSTVVGTVTVDGRVDVLWESEDESTTGGAGPQASFRTGRTALVRCGFRLPPEVCLLADGELRTLASTSHAGTAVVTDAGWASEVRRWAAPDGLEIEGWLHRPPTAGPHPLVVAVHGGPVASHRSGWAALGLVPYLLAQGYAVLQPNPRGSSGRGLDFAAAVVGDMGGADAKDITSAIAPLADTGLVDPARVGVTGGSYGGFMSAWLVTQSDLFAAAVAQYPVTDWDHQHGVSNIPYWDELFLDGKPYARDGQYRSRSPLEHVAQVRTPTLFVAGARDRATPAGQALAMHRALVAHGVPSECVILPNEAHGARDLSAAIDVLSRISDWFEEWLLHP